MKKFSILGILALAALGLQFGCTVTYVEGTPQPAYAAQTDPYPNATHIQNRLNGQMNQIQQAVMMGSLDRDRADLLIQNDNLVSSFATQDRADSNQSMDLTDDQTFSLDNMLNDNAQILNDAINNRQAWNPYFQGNSFDYAVSGNGYLDLIYLDRQLRVQQSQVDIGIRLNKLGPDEAQELRARIRNVQAAKASYYFQNGRFSLSPGQMQQLAWMAQDNAMHLHVRLEGRGHWDRQRFETLKVQAPAPLPRQHPAPGWHPHAAQAQAQARPEPAQASPRQNMANKKAPASAKKKPVAGAKASHPKKVSGTARKSDSKDSDDHKKKDGQ